MKQIIDKIGGFKNKQLGCIEVNLLENNTYIFHLIVLKQEKNKIISDKVIWNIDSLEVLFTYLPSSLPITLVFTGKGIIFRSIDASDTENNNDILRKVLPNATPADFYIERSEPENNESLVSIIRREIAEKVLKLFSDKKLFVIDIFVGPYILRPILNIIDPLLKTINLGAYQVQLSDRKINTCISKEFKGEEVISIGDDKFSNYTLLALSAGITTFSNNFSSVHPEISSIQTNNKEFRAFRLMKIAGIGILSIFFIVLLLNYFIFDSLNTKYNDLTSRLTNYQGFLSNYTLQKNDLEEKKDLLKETGLLQPSKISYYADRIAVDLPAGVRLTELYIHPKTSKKNNRNKINFNRNLIKIKGFTSKGSLLNDWLNTLEEYDWVYEVSSFTISNEEYSNKMADFTIDIDIK